MSNLSSLITQCPNCTTRFKVTEAQLQAAQGKARCGACLSVFEATASLTLDGQPFDYDPSSDLDDLLGEIDSDFPADVAEESPVRETAPKQASASSESPPSQDDDTDTSPGPIESPPTGGIDALEAELMADLMGASTDTPIQEPETRITDSFVIIDEEQSGRTSENPAEVHENWSEDGSEQSADEEIAEATTAEDTADATVEPGDADALEEAGIESAQLDQDQDPIAWDVSDPESQEENAEEDTREDTEDETLYGAEGEAALDDQPEESQGESQEEDIEELAVQPLAIVAGDERSPLSTSDLFDVPEEPPRRKKPVVTFLMIVLAVLVLPAQVLWFQYESWVKDETFRPIYGFICQAVGCDLPPMKDASMIVSRKSISRAHPDQADVRVVDILMVNNAQFPQPFPLIELTFTNVDGQLVAGRRFEPREYLHGEMSNVSLMQPRTPIHVSLELKDPGPSAQGFRVVFR